MRTQKTLSLLATTLRVATTLLVLVLVASANAQSAGPAAANPAAFLPWKSLVFDDDSQAEKLSAAYIGPLQVPVFSYVDSDGAVTLAYPKDSTTLECGPDNTWTCNRYTTSGSVKETFSPIASATDPLDNSYITAWAYEFRNVEIVDDHDIFLLVREWSGEMVEVDGYFAKMIALGDGIWADYTLKGRPSLVIDSNMKFHLALVVHNNSNGLDGLMYLFPSETPDDSCGCGLVQRKCILVDGGHLDGNPVLVLDANGKPRITYYDTTQDSLKFAYPQPLTQMHPNCGPGGNTWRCVDIYTEPDTDTILPQMSMDIGPGYPQIAFMVDVKNSVPEQVRRLYLAQFVGSGGNCGMDYAITSTEPLVISLIPRWKCTNLADIAQGEGTMPYYSLSLQVDTMNYPVIAFAKHFDDGNYLMVIDPPDRLGEDPGSPWNANIFNTNGAKYASLALSDSGPAMVVFKDDDTVSPSLGMRYQSYEIYLPSIMH